MNKTIGKYICAWAVVCLAGCSNEVPQEGQTAVASFHVATRAADNTAEREITDQQFVRLYVAERRPESGKPEATDPSDFALSIYLYMIFVSATKLRFLPSG